MKPKLCYDWNNLILGYLYDYLDGDISKSDLRDAIDAHLMDELELNK